MKLIVVSGGVISGVGKGVASASIAKILQEYGFNVTVVKIDPYVNYDAGTLRPTEHGEVWVTDDGGEIDQDLGNYERFLGKNIPKKNCITTGQIYKTVIDRERSGGYLGQTVRPIPHITDEIKKRILESAEGHDFCVIEIGGTIGDYENIPFLFAAKSLEIEMGKENVIHVLVTYLPVPSTLGEMKTKPTQQAIGMFRESGIAPDFVLCRATTSVDDIRKRKIEVYANIGKENIISAPDIKTVYRVPLNFEKEMLGKKILEKFRMVPRKTPDFSIWSSLVNKIENPSKIINIAMVGKYVDIGDYSLVDSYISINEALSHAGANCDAGIKISWIDSKSFESDPSKLVSLENYAGIIIPGGFGSSGVEGKISAIKFARERDIPFLGLCYGLQLAVVEHARNVCDMDADSTEINPDTEKPVIDVMPLQKKLLEKSLYGATMRLGAYAAILKNNGRVFDLYSKAKRIEKDAKQINFLKENKEDFRLGVLSSKDVVVLERHRHRYEVNPKFINHLERDGFVFSGKHMRNDNTELMEFIERPKHRFFIGTQAHPEFKSRLEDPAPLFLGFVEAARE